MAGFWAQFCLNRAQNQVISAAVKILKLENIPENLCIHLLYIWSDGFQKNTLVKTKKTSLQLFIVYVVPPNGVCDIAKYTFPFALGKKQKDHQVLLLEILQQMKELEQIIYRYCRDTNLCKPTYFERVVIQNDQIEWVNNLSIVQGGTYEKRVAYSIKFDDKKTSLCKKCFLSRCSRVFPSITVQTTLHLNQKHTVQLVQTGG